jgi:hypothetical protein
MVSRGEDSKGDKDVFQGFKAEIDIE